MQGSEEWRAFTPPNVRWNGCLARTWFGGQGGQCSKASLPGSSLCEQHTHKAASPSGLTHGWIHGPIPHKKLLEFQRNAWLNVPAVVEWDGEEETQSVQKKTTASNKKVNASRNPQKGVPSHKHNNNKDGALKGNNPHESLIAVVYHAKNEMVEHTAKEPKLKKPKREPQEFVQSEFEKPEQEIAEFSESLPRGKGQFCPPTTKSLENILDSDGAVRFRNMPNLVEVMSQIDVSQLGVRFSALLALQNTKRATAPQAFVACGGVPIIRRWLVEAFSESKRSIKDDHLDVVLRSLELIGGLPITYAELQQGGLGRTIWALRGR